MNPERNRKGAASAWIVVILAFVFCVIGFQAVRWMTKPPETGTTTEAAPVVTVETVPAKLAAWPRRV